MFWTVVFPTPQAPHIPKRFNFSAPPGGTLGGSIALSPEGARLAYDAWVDEKHRLYIRSLDRLQAAPVPESEAASTPFFSPDGEWLGFFDRSSHTLRKVPAEGGGPITLCDAPDIRGASWGENGTIVFATGASSGLWRVSAEGGAPVELTRTDPARAELSHRYPDVLPRGRAALFTIVAPSGRQDEARIALLSLETGEWRVLIEGGSFGRYVTTGHIVYALYGSLLAVPFDLDRLEVTGAAVPLLDDVWMASSGSGIALFSISRSGALAYVSGAETAPERSLVWVDRQGRVEPVTQERRAFGVPGLSPDGERLAVGVTTGRNSDIWLYDLRRQTRSRLTFEKDNFGPVWTPDGQHIVFSSNREGSFNLFRKPVDGSGKVERLTTSTQWQSALSFSPDGRLLTFQQQESDTLWDIWILPLEGKS